MLTINTQKEKKQQGFTLIEMLVAIFIVGLALTVFLQILSGSMKLSYKSRTLIDYTRQADEVFSALLLQDIKNEQFEWSGNVGQQSWQLYLYALEIKKPIEDSQDQLIINLPAELFLFEFTLYSDDGRPVVVLKEIRQYPVGSLNDAFKQQYVLPWQPSHQLKGQGGS